MEQAWPWGYLDARSDRAPGRQYALGERGFDDKA